MTVRLINDVAVSDYMIRRLQDVANGRIGRPGCRNCRNMTFDRLAAAGLIEVSPLGSGYDLTDAGEALLAEWQSS